MTSRTRASSGVPGPTDWSVPVNFEDQADYGPRGRMDPESTVVWSGRERPWEFKGLPKQKRINSLLFPRHRGPEETRVVWGKNPRKKLKVQNRNSVKGAFRRV